MEQPRDVWNPLLRMDDESPALGGIWDAFRRQVERFHAGGLDIFFLAFLMRVERFGYFTLGPITIDVRLIEDIVARTTLPDTKSPPGLGDDMALCEKTGCVIDFGRAFQRSLLTEREGPQHRHLQGEP